MIEAMWVAFDLVSPMQCTQDSWCLNPDQLGSHIEEEYSDKLGICVIDAL